MNDYLLEPYKIIYNFTIELVSPLIIGSGERENSDIDVIKDKDGNPFIPATSFAGVLRHHLQNNYNNLDIKKYFGYTKDKESLASKIVFWDLIAVNDDINIVIRDGIKIDNKTGIPFDKAKFDFEVIEPGAKFKSNIEIHGNKDEVSTIERIIKTIDKDLKDGEIKIGAKTNSGFGEIRLIMSRYNFYDLTKKEDIVKWLLKEDNEIDFATVKPLDYTYNNDLVITFDFFLKDSLIVKHYSIDTDAPDAVHIKSNNRFIIPGTSIKGVIRARGEKILNTLEINNREDFLKFLFGDSLEEKKGSIPSRLSVNEVVIKQDVEPGIQQRIRIDRFTQGTIKGALFDSMPIYAKNFNTPNTLKIKVKNPHESEAGLLLLILKDLWTGDLAIGGEKNIGRGTLEGLRFSLKYKDFEIKGKNFKELTNDDKEKLQKYVDSLNNSEFTGHLNRLREKYQSGGFKCIKMA